MATLAWLRGPSAMRLTEGLVSILKEQRPEYLPALLANYREHGVFQTQVEPGPERHVSLGASYLFVAVLQLLQALSFTGLIFGDTVTLGLRLLW